MQLITEKEVVKLHKHTTVEHADFIMHMMKIYGCNAAEGDDWNLLCFLLNIFNAGKIEGIREERYRRKYGKKGLEKLRQYQRGYDRPVSFVRNDKGNVIQMIITTENGGTCA